MTTKKPAPAPGVYHDVDFAEYASWAAVNHSALSLLDEGVSMEHVHHALREPGEDSAAMAFGRAVHLCVFEPERAAQSLMCAPINPATGESYGFGTKKWDEAAAANPGKTMVRSTEYAQLKAMAEALNTNTEALALIGSEGRSEVSIVWDENGVPCKARIDRVTDLMGGTLIDLKTCESAGYRALSKAVQNFGWHTKQAWYQRGANAVGIACDEFRFICVEKSAPWGVAVVRVRDEAVQVGKQLVNEWMSLVSPCWRDGTWPGYPSDVIEVDLPRWAYAQYEGAE